MGSCSRGGASRPSSPCRCSRGAWTGAIITHAHLDHSGNVPSLYTTGDVDSYATDPTFDLSELLIKDMLKLQKSKQYPFGQPELHNMMRNAVPLEYGQKRQEGRHIL